MADPRQHALSRGYVSGTRRRLCLEHQLLRRAWTRSKGGQAVAICSPKVKTAKTESVTSRMLASQARRKAALARRRGGACPSAGRTPAGCRRCRAGGVVGGGERRGLARGGSVGEGAWTSGAAARRASPSRSGAGSGIPGSGIPGSGIPGSGIPGGSTTDCTTSGTTDCTTSGTQAWSQLAQRSAMPRARSESGTR